MEKYKNLRDGLQNDTGNETATKELSRFERRLNRIDAQNFQAPRDFMEDEHEAQHARVEQPAEPLLSRRQARKEPSFDKGFFEDNENDSTFDNDFLDQYIREVKQYNIDQGNAVSDNTRVNVLNNIKGAVRNETPAPLKPYPTQRKQPDTADIPFKNSMRRNQESFENTEKIPVVSQYEEEPQARTKEDIMAEVQNLVNGVKKQGYLKEDDPADAYDKNLEADRASRQQLLNETTQMRAQLDDYEDNLNEVNDKMRQTNRILNIVLIVLILALITILGIVIYWILLSRS
ncbi:MAG: hypothetical protein K6A40_03350 [Solobacterium sp.]|nr:hypothetical protein [Solobacterium sp.]